MNLGYVNVYGSAVKMNLNFNRVLIDTRDTMSGSSSIAILSLVGYTSEDQHA